MAPKPSSFLGQHYAGVRLVEKADAIFKAIGEKSLRADIVKPYQRRRLCRQYRIFIRATYYMGKMLYFWFSECHQKHTSSAEAGNLILYKTMKNFAQARYGC